MNGRNTYLDGIKCYPWCMAGHHAQGMLCGAFLFNGQWALSLLWAMLYVSYQGLSVIRKKDSAGLDVMDFMVGLGIVTLIGILFQ